MRELSRICNGLVGQPMFNLLAKVDAMEMAGRKVLHFEIGDSEFEAHPHIVEATKKALDNYKTHYVNSMGILELREAICDHTEQSLGFRPDVNQILIMPANGIIDFVVRCVANPGEEFLCPDPGFSTYIAVASYTGVKKVGVLIREENAFRMEAREVAKRITDKTRLIIINSPSNPTGAVMEKEEIDGIAAIAKEKDVYLLSDEIYSRNIYGKIHYSPAVTDKCRERTIILNGFSKGYAMPGWRLGYAIGPEVVIRKMGLLFETTYSCAPPFIQYAGIAALKGDQQVVEERIHQYKICRDLIVKGLNEIPGIYCPVPDGATYVFPSIKETGMTSVEFADFALEKAGVALLPGTCFGDQCEGYVRLAYARQLKTIEEACEKMKRIFAGR